jgi:archaellum biogenesis protein FlaJ (TadC family)
MSLQIATYAAAACLLGTTVTRTAAIPGLIVAIIGLLTVFGFYATSTEEAAWHQSTAMTAYGLAIIAALMILVERKERLCESS